MRTASVRSTRGIQAALLAATVLLLGFLAPAAGWAWEEYSVDKDSGNCADCHGPFRDDPYFSLTDGQDWGNSLHEVHETIVNGDCDTCHTSGGRTPVLLGSSNGGDGLAALSCMGCHGRMEDGAGGAVTEMALMAPRPQRWKRRQSLNRESARISLELVRQAGDAAVSDGFGAGLRQHHQRTGTTECLSCHADADPTVKTVVGEDVPPPYYANPGNNHPAIPDDPCNPPPARREQFAGTVLGLDNDGDLDYDGDDVDCSTAVCGDGITGVGEECDDGNTSDGDCCSSTCLFEVSGSACDNGNFCTVSETCDGAGTCDGGVPRDCSDAVFCTVDACDEAADSCTHTPDDGLCANGDFCDGDEICDLAQDCQPGTAVDCDDADICSDDSCNEITDTCDNIFDPNRPGCQVGCGNGFVDAGEECDDGNTNDGDCCSSTCTFEAAGSTCDDGLFCSVADACDGAGSCQGTARDCDDGVSCTQDACDEASARCVRTPDDNVCDNGQFCDGTEVCDLVQDCQSGPAVDCDDADICTDDTCNETTDVCDHLFVPANDPTCLASCPDDDLDGFSTAGGFCGLVDCDDQDATVNPAAAEVCDDDKDNDCDGLVDAADESCNFDGSVDVRSGPLDDPTYAGSPACADCHEEHYDDWLGSLHARMQIRPGDAQAAGFPLPDPDPGSVEITSWSDVLFVVGQKWRTEYVDRSGRIQGMRWNYLFGQWDAINGGALADYDCGSCHTTGFDPSATFVDDAANPVPGIEGSWVEYGVGCETCHGPGAEHAADPSKDNINRITGGGADPVALRSTLVCAGCHSRGNPQVLQTDRLNHEQANDWAASPHSSTLELTSVSTYCAQCHSPGNADYYAEEHNFDYFEPADASHVTCISCHNPHNTSQPRWETLEFPPAGRQDARSEPPLVARYRGTDGDYSSSDYDDIAGPNELCGDCHRQVVGFRRHLNVEAPSELVLMPPGNDGNPFVMPHREHVELGNADCVDCHMNTTRESANEGDVRSHVLWPDERWRVSDSFSLPHFDETCSQCHNEAEDCTWCHSEFGAR